MSNEAELFSTAFAVPIISPQGIIKNEKSQRTLEVH